MRGIYLENLTWKDAEEAFQKFEVVVIPLGAALKEHGLHLPLNNDFRMAEYLARRVANELPVLITPTIPYHFFPAFVEYPGSVNISRDTARDYAMDICRSLHSQGAKKFYILNTGVSTNRALEPARLQLASEGIFMEYTNLLEAKADTKKILEQEGGTHADESETSMMLYIAPETVKMHLAERDYRPENASRPGPLTRDINANSGTFSPTGAWGDPALATVEKGKMITENLVKNIVAEIENFAQHDYQPAPPREVFLK